MQKIIFLKNYEEYFEGDIVFVDNNKAHSIIDGGFAKVFKDYEDKMMRSNKRRKYERHI